MVITEEKRALIGVTPVAVNAGPSFEAERRYSFAARSSARRTLTQPGLDCNRRALSTEINL
jgi:hypothetical protein